MACATAIAAASATGALYTGSARRRALRITPFRAAAAAASSSASPPQTRSALVPVSRPQPAAIPPSREKHSLGTESSAEALLCLLQRGGFLTLLTAVAPLPAWAEETEDAAAAAAAAVSDAAAAATDAASSAVAAVSDVAADVVADAAAVASSAADAAGDAAAAAAEAAVESPDWFSYGVLFLPLISYGLFFLLREKVNPKAGVLDFLFVLVLTVIIANILSILILKVRIY